MDQGKIAENDSPAALLKQKGIFYEMCRKTGEYDELELIANPRCGELVSLKSILAKFTKDCSRKLLAHL